MRYHLLTLALFGAAALMWFLGMRDDAFWLVLAAGIAEILAWKRVFKPRHTA